MTQLHSVYVVLYFTTKDFFKHFTSLIIINKNNNNDNRVIDAKGMFLSLIKKRKCCVMDSEHAVVLIVSTRHPHTHAHQSYLGDKDSAGAAVQCRAQQ